MKDYEPKKYKPSMRDIVKSKAGKGQIYLDKKARKVYTKKQICDGIKNGNIKEGYIRVIDGKEIPCKKPKR